MRNAITLPSFYHLSAKIISRGTGQSAVACAAYRSGTSLSDARYGKVHDYQPRRGILEHGIALPEAAPRWMKERGELWNAVERAERRKDAQLSREFELSFAHQLTHEQRRELLREFLTKEITSRGLVADWAIHAPNRAGDQRNYHAHVMTSLRAVDGDGFAVTKDRGLNKPDQLVAWRAAWADIQNRGFERYGILDEHGRPLRVDHRSYQEQGLGDREPTIHMGTHATTLERRYGLQTELGDLNRMIVTMNEARDLVDRQVLDLLRGQAENPLLVNDGRPGRYRPEPYEPHRYRPERPSFGINPQRDDRGRDDSP